MIRDKRKMFLLILFSISITGVLSTIIFKTYRNREDAKVFSELNNYIKVNSYSIGDETLTVANEITNMIMNYNTINVIDANNNNCTLEIIYPNVAQICKKIMASSENWDRSNFLASKTYFLDTLKNQLESQNFEYLSQDIELKVVKNGDKYEFIETEEYMDAIYGGLLTFYNELYDDPRDETGDNQK